jgi:hypothetical protein
MIKTDAFVPLDEAAVKEIYTACLTESSFE